MKISSGAIGTAVDYLSEFGADDACVLFTPDGPDVRASTRTQGGYAEYLLRPQEPLRERFALAFNSLREMSAQLGDESLRYTRASSAKFVGQQRQWWIPFAPLPDEERPQIYSPETVIWKDKLQSYLSVMGATIRKTHSRNCLDCVFVDQRAQRESIVATDGQMMVAYCRRNLNKMPAPRSILLQHEHVRPFRKLCESRSPVQIEIGATAFSARCGRRFAIFDSRSGCFPRWETWFTKGRSMATGAVPTTGVATTTVNELAKFRALKSPGHATITIGSDEGGLRLSEEGSTDGCHVVIKSRVENYFGPVRLRASYLRCLAQAWPYQSIQLRYQRANEPIVFCSPRSDRSLIALIMPIVR